MAAVLAVDAEDAADLVGAGAVRRQDLGDHAATGILREGVDGEVIKTSGPGSDGGEVLPGGGVEARVSHRDAQGDGHPRLRRHRTQTLLVVNGGIQVSQAVENLVVLGGHPHSDGVVVVVILGLFQGRKDSPRCRSREAEASRRFGAFRNGQQHV